MVLNILFSALLTAAFSLSTTSVNPAGLAVGTDGSVWMSTTNNTNTASATLDVWRYDAGVSASSLQDGIRPSTERPVLSIRPDGQAVIGGSLYRDRSGRLLLFYTLTKGSYDGEGQVWMRVCEQPAAAPANWSSPVRVGIGCVCGAPLELSDGTLVLATALWGPYCMDPDYKTAHPELDARRGSLVFRSTDGGKNWKDSGVRIMVPERRDAAYNNPKLYLMPDGRLAMVLRSCDSGYAYRCVSADQGLSWSIPTPFILNPDRDLAVRTLSDGRLLLVKNFRLDYVQYYPARELFAYLSDDGGTSWYGYQRVTTDDYAIFPMTAELPSGEVLVAWGHQQPGSSEVKLAVLPAARPEHFKKAAAAAVLFTADGAAAAFEKHCASQMQPRTNWCKTPVRLATWNIQREGWGGGPKWVDRRENVFAEFREHDWDLVGSQEASTGYAEEICKAMNDEYAWVANCPKFYGKAARGGSEQPIIYRKSRFELLACGPLEYAIDRNRFQGTIMCADSYGVDYYKATTWAKFHDKANDIDFYFYNLHMPVRADAAQAAEALILREDILSRCEGLPVVITGDFNSMEDSWAWHYLNELPYIKDAKTLIPESQCTNRLYGSWCGYSGQLKPGDGLHHDHVYCSPASIRVLDWELDIDTIHNGKHSSDHLPITINFLFGK